MRGIILLMTGKDPGTRMDSIIDVYDALGVKHREVQRENYTEVFCEYDEGWED